MASSKTFLSPLWLRAEHSRNFLHRIFLCCRDFTRLLAWTQKDMIYHHMIILRSKGVEVIFLNVPTSALETISWFFSLSFSISLGSSLRSALVPTSSIGVSGQWCVTWAYESCQAAFNKDTTSRSPVDSSTRNNIVTSGIHLDSTLSKLVGLVRAKHTRNMSWNIMTFQVDICWSKQVHFSELTVWGYDKGLSLS